MKLTNMRNNRCSINHINVINIIISINYLIIDIIILLSVDMVDRTRGENCMRLYVSILSKLVIISFNQYNFYWILLMNLSLSHSYCVYMVRKVLRNDQGRSIGIIHEK